MKVILVTSTTPFVFGGATLIVEWLEQALVRRGHEVETFQIPFLGMADQMPGQLAGIRLWDFTGVGDRLIAVRTPSYLVRHHSKVLWFIHHHRPSYDLWDTHRDVPLNRSGEEFRRMMFASDDLALTESERVFTNSTRVADRLRVFNDVEAEVLYPPLAENFAPTFGGSDGPLLYVSRVASHKRQYLAVEALAHTKNPVTLTILGSGYGGDEPDRIFRLIDRLGLAQRVSFINTQVSDETKYAAMRDSRAVLYFPEDEDSYGFVGLEAALHQKPVITTSDSGGVRELIEHGVNGLVAEPTPQALAEAYDRLWVDREYAERLGSAQDGRLEQLHISWDHVVERLLA